MSDNDGSDTEEPMEAQEASETGIDDDGDVTKSPKKDKKKSKKKKKEKDKDKEKSKSKKKDKDKDKEKDKEKKKKKEKSSSKEKKEKSSSKDKKEKKDKKKSKDKKDKSKSKKDKKKPEEEVPPPPPDEDYRMTPPIKVAPVMLESLSDNEDKEENSADERMKELLAAWDNDEDSSDDSSDSDDEEDEAEEVQELGPSGATKAELGLEDNALDHIVLASPDFAEAIKEFESMTGIKPSIVGSLRGLGLKTARVGLDNNAYIEILGPDPKKSGPVGDQLKRLEDGTLIPYHFAVRGTDLAEVAEDYVPNELGWDPDRIAMYQTKKDGTPAKWEMLFMYRHFMGGTVPFYVDWGECDHPIANIPLVGQLKNFTVRAPGGTKVHQLLHGVKDINVEAGELGLEFSFGSPEGTITFTSEKPIGIKFPGYEEKELGPALSGPGAALAAAAAAASGDSEGEGTDGPSDDDDDDSDASGKDGSESESSEESEHESGDESEEEPEDRSEEDAEPSGDEAELSEDEPEPSENLDDEEGEGEPSEEELEPSDNIGEEGDFALSGEEPERSENPEGDGALLEEEPELSENQGDDDGSVVSGDEHSEEYVEEVVDDSD